jgi:hypothetical protein
MILMNYRLEAAPSIANTCQNPQCLALSLTSRGKHIAFALVQNICSIAGYFRSYLHNIYNMYILADSGFFLDFYYQGGVKSTVSWVFEDLKFKISEGYKQN